MFSALRLISESGEQYSPFMALEHGARVEEGAEYSTQAKLGKSGIDETNQTHEVQSDHRGGCMRGPPGLRIRAVRWLVYQIK